MINTWDLIVAELARGFRAASTLDPPLRIVAMTSNSSLVAARMAQDAGADISIATGFTVLDGDPRPSLSLGAAAMGMGASARGPISDTFVALARGWIGVVVSPAQLDGRARTNLSRVGGNNAAPRVALPGSRGLPENNSSPSRVWYLVPNHSPRALVVDVDFVSGPEPPPERSRRLITNLGVFDHSIDGWRLRSRMPGSTPAAISSATGFPVLGVDAAEEVAPLSSSEREAFDRIDPDRLSHFELGRDPAEMVRYIVRERTD